MNPLPPECYVRMADLADLNALVDLEYRCFDHDLISGRSWRRFIHKKMVWVIHTDKLIASMVLLHRKKSSMLRLYSVAIHPDARGKGLSHLLLEFAKQYAIEHDYEGIHLEVAVSNKPAVRLYEKQSFIKYGLKTAYYQSGEDALQMYWEVPKN